MLSRTTTSITIGLTLVGLPVAAQPTDLAASLPQPRSQSAGAVSAATSTPPEVLTLDAALASAIRKNPRLEAVGLSIAAAQSGLRAARALTNPTLVFTPAITPGGADEEFLAIQPLELNGARSARSGVARAQVRQVEAQAVIELRELVWQIRTAYYELARTREQRSLAEDLLLSAEAFHTGVRRQAEEGLRPEIDPVQTAIEVSRVRQQVTLSVGEVKRATLSLNTLMGCSPTDPIKTLSPIRFQPVALDRDAAVRQALDQRAEISLLEATRDAFLKEASLARAQGRPDLAPQLRAGGLLRGVNDAGVGLGITLPLFDYGSRRHRVRQAQEAAAAQEARIAVARLQVQQDVEQAVVRLQSAEAVIREYQSGVLDQTRRLRDAGLRGLQLGAPGASILTALEVQRTYRNVLTEYNSALTQHAQALADLERATGAVPASLLPLSGLQPTTPPRRAR